MGHSINAFIGKPAMISNLIKNIPESIIDLSTDFKLLSSEYQMLFYTVYMNEYFDELFKDDSIPENLKTIWVDKSMIKFIETYCKNGLLAYIETDYFGGIGEQAAILFKNGNLIIPEYEKDWLINSVLKKIGVIKKNNLDEFDTINLSEYRKMPDLRD